MVQKRRSTVSRRQKQPERDAAKIVHDGSTPHCEKTKALTFGKRVRFSGTICSVGGSATLDVEHDNKVDQLRLAPIDDPQHPSSYVDLAAGTEFKLHCRGQGCDCLYVVEEL